GPFPEAGTAHEPAPRPPISQPKPRATPTSPPRRGFAPTDLIELPIGSSLLLRLNDGRSFFLLLRRNKPVAQTCSACARSDFVMVHQAAVMIVNVLLVL